MSMTVGTTDGGAGVGVAGRKGLNGLAEYGTDRKSFKACGRVLRCRGDLIVESPTSTVYI